MTVYGLLLSDNRNYYVVPSSGKIIFGICFVPQFRMHPSELYRLWTGNYWHNWFKVWHEGPLNFLKVRVGAEAERPHHCWYDASCGSISLKNQTGSIEFILPKNQTATIKITCRWSAYDRRIWAYSPMDPKGPRTYIKPVG